MAIPYIPPVVPAPGQTPAPTPAPSPAPTPGPAAGGGWLNQLLRRLMGQGWGGQMHYGLGPQRVAAPANWAQMQPLEQIQWWRDNPNAWIPAADGGRGDWRWAHMNTYDYERNKYLDDLAKAYAPAQPLPSIPNPGGGYSSQEPTATAPGFPAEWGTLPPELKRRWWDDWRARQVQTQTGD